MKWMFFLVLLSVECFGQTNNYPQNYFRNPLNIPILLAGNFGECRPGHFHSGIDIKTEGKENLPVFAAADGYISRVKMEPGGFGHGVYITHPNGFTTLYAHLNNFFPALQKLVHQTQYANKEWTLDLNFPPEKFPVTKGQQIARSGNTGGSSAPHLHFEIRDSKTEHPLNPQLFGFKIIDHLSPVPSQLAIYNASESIYEQKPQLIKLTKTGQYYQAATDTVIVAHHSINIGLAVNDFMNNSTNTLSIYTAEWYANDTLMGSLTLDDIGYDETRYLNACADYKLKKESGLWFNSLFLLPNNKLSHIYHFGENQKGSIILSTDKCADIRIELKDVSDNKSTIILKVIQQVQTAEEQSCSTPWEAGRQNSFDNPNLKFTLPATALYDNICFEVNKSYDANSPSSRWKIHNATIPIHNYFQLSIKPEVVIPFALINKIALCSNNGKTSSAKMAHLSEGWYSASVRDFGEYWLAIDTIAPKIKAVQKNGSFLGNKKELSFVVEDDLTSVKQFTGTINGIWLCFEQHGNNWFYQIDEYCPKGKSKLELSAIDENGNETKMDFIFTR
jgi:hypothetical protein